MVEKISRPLGGSPLAKIAVLIVDDDQKFVKLVLNVLRAFGFSNLHSASNGKEALDLMYQHDIDLVITDWVMEPIDGIEFIKFLRTDMNSPNRFVPVIMLTGKADRDHVEEARDAGATEFLAKPFTVGRFRERIIGVVDAPREFVASETYTGPTRRRRKDKVTASGDRRRKDRDPWAEES